MKEIICTTQAELDAVPTDYDGRVIIKFGTPHNRAKVNRKFKYSVEAWGNSSVEAWGNSSVEAWGNSQAYRKDKNAKIVAHSNAREVHPPQPIIEYAKLYDLPIDAETQTIKLYKAVHRQSGEDYYVADFDASFKYVIGETAIPNAFDNNVEKLCGKGINLAYRAWAVAYGQNWPDLAILECECKCDDVLVPEFTDGKVRVRSAKYLRNERRKIMKLNQILTTYICFILLAVLIGIVSARAAYTEPITMAAATEALYGAGEAPAQVETETHPVTTTCYEMYFTEDDVCAMAKMLWGEARGCTEDNQIKCCWVVLNRVDDPRFPDSIIGVLEQPCQFFGYSESYPVTDELYDIAFDVLTRWSYERQGVPVRRELPSSYLWFTGDGVENIFREEY